MSDDEKKTEVVLDEAPKHPMSAAVHTDELWGGPRWVHHATEKPVWCETQSDYWKLLSKHGFRMTDQAESTTKHEELREVTIPREFTPSPVRPPMTQGEAHLVAAADAVFKGRDFHCVVFHCSECYIRNRFEWCQVVMTPSQISISCKCGTFGYTPPKGTTDLMMARLPSLAVRSEAPTIATLHTPQNGHFTVPAQFFTDQEALILKAFVRMLRDRELELHVFHRTCFRGDPSDVSNEVGLRVAHDEIVAVCPCRMLCHTSVAKDETTH